MDMTTFFAYAKRAPFGVRLSQAQINGINVILAQWSYYKLDSERKWLAYVLASIFHETAGRMVPVRETLASSDAGAIAALEKAWASGKLKVSKPYWRKDAAGRSWFGRGDIQITHQRNYEKLGRRLDVDLVGNPSLALDPVISARIAIVGMAEGLFTGVKLSDHFTRTKEEPEAARAIVNGSDKARLIAGYYRNFLDAIEAAYAAKKKGIPADVRLLDAKADDVPASQSKTVWTVASGLIASGGLGVAKEVADSGANFLGAISNPWAFASLAFAIVAAGAFFWLLASGRLTIARR